jgi:hypothetical protein
MNVPALSASISLFSYPARARMRGTICSTSFCISFMDKARLYASCGFVIHHVDKNNERGLLATVSVSVTFSFS